MSEKTNEYKIENVTYVVESIFSGNETLSDIIGRLALERIREKNSGKTQFTETAEYDIIQSE